MQILPKAENGRFLALMLLLIAFVVGYLALVHWWFTARHLEIVAEMDRIRDDEASLRADASQRKLIEKKLAEVEKFESANPAFLQQPEGDGVWDFDTASAGLVTKLKQVVNLYAKDPQICSITQTTNMRAVEPERFERARINVRLKCDVQGFAQILHDLEGASPILFVEDLQLWKQQTYRQQGSNLPSSYLDISFNLSGYLHIAPPEEKKS